MCYVLYWRHVLYIHVYSCLPTIFDICLKCLKFFFFCRCCFMLWLSCFHEQYSSLWALRHLQVTRQQFHSSDGSWCTMGHHIILMIKQWWLWILVGFIFFRYLLKYLGNFKKYCRWHDCFMTSAQLISVHMYILTAATRCIVCAYLLVPYCGFPRCSDHLARRHPATSRRIPTLPLYKLVDSIV